MRRIIKANLPIVREVVSTNDIKAEIANLGELYKLEILDSIPDGEIITRYFIGSPDTGKVTKSDSVRAIGCVAWFDARQRLYNTVRLRTRRY